MQIQIYLKSLSREERERLERALIIIIHFPHWQVPGAQVHFSHLQLSFPHPLPKAIETIETIPSISFGTHSKLCIDNWNHTYIDQICCSYRCRHIFQLDEKKEAKMWADPDGRFTFTVARHLSCVGRMKISWTSLVRIELYL